MRRYAAVVLKVFAVVGFVGLHPAFTILEHHGAGVHLVERGESLVVVLGVKQIAFRAVPPVYDRLAVVVFLFGKSGKKAACLDVFLFVDYKAAH